MSDNHLGGWDDDVRGPRLLFWERSLKRRTFPEQVNSLESHPLRLKKDLLLVF